MQLTESDRKEVQEKEGEVGGQAALASQHLPTTPWHTPRRR